MFRRLRLFLEMIRFSHTLFALPFALLAAVMAWSAPAEPPVTFRWRELAGILLCMVCARSAAMAFNRLADRHIDAQNPRTATRHLPAGLLSPGAVLAFTLVSSLGFIAATSLFLPNPLPLYLAVPVLLFLGGYSYAKRFTSLAHFWLGTALMLAPISAWIALRGTQVMASPGDLIPSAWLGFAVLLWVAGFDIIYACQDVGFDVKAELRSVPAAIGVRAALRVSAVCHFLMIGVLASLPFTVQWGGPPLGLGAVYHVGIAAVALLLVYEHWLVRPDDLTRVNVSFFHVNAIVSLGLLVVGVIDLLIF